MALFNSCTKLSNNYDELRYLCGTEISETSRYSVLDGEHKRDSISVVNLSGELKPNLVTSRGCIVHSDEDVIIRVDKKAYLLKAQEKEGYISLSTRVDDFQIRCAEDTKFISNKLAGIIPDVETIGFLVEGTLQEKGKPIWTFSIDLSQPEIEVPDSIQEGKYELYFKKRNLWTDQTSENRCSIIVDRTAPQPPVMNIKGANKFTLRSNYQNFDLVLPGGKISFSSEIGLYQLDYCIIESEDTSTWENCSRTSLVGDKVLNEIDLSSSLSKGPLTILYSGKDQAMNQTSVFQRSINPWSPDIDKLQDELAETLEKIESKSQSYTYNLFYVLNEINKLKDRLETNLERRYLHALELNVLKLILSKQYLLKRYYLGTESITKIVKISDSELLISYDSGSIQFFDVSRFIPSEERYETGLWFDADFDYEPANGTIFSVDDTYSSVQIWPSRNTAQPKVKEIGSSISSIISKDGAAYASADGHIWKIGSDSDPEIKGPLGDKNLKILRDIKGNAYKITENGQFSLWNDRGPLGQTDQLVPQIKVTSTLPLESYLGFANDTDIGMIDLNTRKTITFPHNSSIYSMTISDPASKVVAGTDGYLNLFNFDSFNQDGADYIRLGQDSAGALVSIGEDRLIAGHLFGGVHEWDINGEKLEFRNVGVSSREIDTLSSSGSMLLARDKLGKLYILDHNMDLLQTIVPECRSGSEIFVTINGWLIGCESYLLIINQGKKPIHRIRTPFNASGLIFADDRIVLSKDSNNLYLAEYTTAELTKQKTFELSPNSVVAGSQKFVAIKNDKTVSIYDTDFNMMKSFAAPENLDSLAFSSDSSYLRGHYKNQIYVWDILSDVAPNRITLNESISRILRAKEPETLAYLTSQGNIVIEEYGFSFSITSPCDAKSVEVTSLSSTIVIGCKDGEVFSWSRSFDVGRILQGTNAEKQFYSGEDSLIEEIYSD